MTVDHFIAVRWSLKHQILMRRRVVGILVASSWILSIINGMLFNMMTHEGVKKAGDIMINELDYYYEYYDELHEQWSAWNYKESDGKYFLELKQETFFKISLAVNFSLISAVLLVLLVVYVYIARVLLKVAKERRYRQRLSIASTAEERSAQMRRRRVKGLCTTISLLVSFLLLWTPLQVYHMISFLKTNDSAYKGLDSGKDERIMIVLCSCTSIVDIFIYVLRSQEVMRRLKEFRNRYSKFRSSSSTGQHYVASKSNSSNNNSAMAPSRTFSSKSNTCSTDL